MATSEDLVRSLLVEQLGLDPAAVTLNSRLVEDLEVNSPDMIAIIQQIEELANLTILEAVSVLHDRWRRREVRRRQHARKLASNYARGGAI